MTQHVLYVANASKIGGANRVMMDLVGGLDRQRFVPHLIVPCEGPLLDWARHHDVAASIVRDGDIRGRLAQLRRALQLASAIKEVDARIVHAIDPSCYRAAGLAGRLTGVPRVCHVEFPATPRELAWSFKYGPETVVACHQAQADEIAASVGTGRRVLSIPNAVDLARFRTAPPSSATAEWRFGAKHVVLVVGHLSDVKGHPTFLRAAAIVQRQLGDCAFLLLGGETLQAGFGAQLERMAAELGIRDCVHFLGWHSSVEAIVHAADVVAQPSLAEGLPLAVLEAMACARPVVATPVGGVPEAIEHEKSGLLVPASDPSALASALVRLLRDRDRARAMGAEARRRIEEQFSLAAFLYRVQAMYDDTLGRGRGSL